MLSRRARSTSVVTAAVSLVAAVAAACGGDGMTEPSDAPSEGISFLDGAGQTDTVRAKPAQALVVEIRGAEGELLAGEVVRFEAETAEGDFFPVPTMLVATLAGSSFRTSAADSTDGDGTAAVRIQMGTVAGTGEIRVHVPVHAYVDTARFTVEPGALAGIELEPSDTTIALGSSFELRPAGVDRFGNPRDDEGFTIESSGELSVDGYTVTGLAVGEGTVTARRGEAMAEARVDVIPDGTAAMSQQASGSTPHGLVATKLDGSEHTVLLESSGSASFGGIDWSPAGDRLVYHRSDPIDDLFVVDLEGNTRTLLDVASPTRPRAASFGPAGSWIYFEATSDTDVRIWRIRPDGTGLEAITTDSASFADDDRSPHPSPSGDRLVMRSNEGFSQGQMQLQVLDLATGQATSLGVDGTFPVWSPTGEWIAYLDFGAIRAVRPDGTDGHVVANGRFEHGLDWSPNGQWLISFEYPKPHVVNFTTGEAVSLDVFTDFLWFPAWRP